MFEATGFGQSVELLQRLMNVASLRREAISNNLDNAETPNYKRSDISFEAELKRAFDSRASSKLEARMLEERHIPFSRPRDWREVRPRRYVDYLTKTDNNGNNVSLEQEVQASLQNELIYSLMANSVANHFTQLNMVLRS